MRIKKQKNNFYSTVTLEIFQSMPPPPPPLPGMGMDIFRNHQMKDSITSAFLMYQSGHKFTYSIYDLWIVGLLSQ